MGGLIVKRAFINAAATGSQYPTLLINMKGVVFLGTPHRGAQLAAFRIIKATLNSTVAIQQIQPYCKTVEEIYNDFNELNIPSISFYESMGMGIFGLNQVKCVSKKSLIIGCCPKDFCSDGL
jgi:hypothetical protein